jgi:hypothetical protein
LSKFALQGYTLENPFSEQAYYQMIRKALSLELVLQTAVDKLAVLFPVRRRWGKYPLLSDQIPME